MEKLKRQGRKFCIGGKNGEKEDFRRNKQKNTFLQDKRKQVYSGFFTRNRPDFCVKYTIWRWEKIPGNLVVEGISF